MEETLLRIDPFTGVEVPRCDIPETDILRILRGKLHTVNISTDPGKQIAIEALLPNYDADEITVGVHQGCLLIQAERNVENEKYMVRGSSSLYRRLPLPPEAKEHLIAIYFHEGILRVIVPLVEFATDSGGPVPD